MASWTTPRWCPPREDGQPYTWTISALINGKRWWSTQSRLYGGPPGGADLAELLDAAVANRSRKAALWRLQVTGPADPTTVLAEVEQWFDAHEPPTRRMRNSRGLR